jgi:hypothetical protein
MSHLLKDFLSDVSSFQEDSFVESLYHHVHCFAMASAAPRLGRCIPAAAAASAYISAWSRQTPSRCEGPSSRPSSGVVQWNGMVKT